MGLTACGGGSASTTQQATSSQSAITSVTVSGAASVLTGGSTQFTKSVSGTGNYNAEVAWSASAGSIDSNGLFTAPAAPCTVTVTATSKQDPSIKGSASITVTASQTAQSWHTLLDGSEFSDDATLWANFSNAYPWGTDHNGTARMLAANAVTDSNGTLVLTSQTTSGQGKSNKDPYCTINYFSGTVYWKSQVEVDDTTTQWTIEGDFAVPVSTGTWPAFWLTAVNSWPPESDIMEYINVNSCRQNTFNGTYPNYTTLAHTLTVETPESFHHYKVWIQKISTTDVLLTYYVDGVQTFQDTGTNWAGQPLWLILDLQMGSNCIAGPSTNQHYYAKNLVVRSYY
jgi:hypothetical protein